MDVSLIIPAHNEETRLPRTLAVYGQTLREQYGDDFEILVVANGCTDATATVARAAAASLPVRVIERAEAVGKGGAVVIGLRHACGDRLVIADADAATMPESLVALCAALDRCDVAIGSRRVRGSIVAPPPLTRRVFSLLFAYCVRILFRLPFADTQCGAKALRRDAALRIAPLVHEAGWAFDVDLLLVATALGLSVVEHPVEWSHRPGSRLKVRSALREVPRALWRMKRRERALKAAAAYEKQPLRILALNWRCLHHPQAGGAERNLFAQAERWVRDGNEVTAVCANPGRAFVLGDTETINGVMVRRMGGRFTVYLRAAVFMLRHRNRFDRVLDAANGVPFFAPLFTDAPVTLLVHHVHGRQWFREFPAPVAAIGWFLEHRIVPLAYRDEPVIAVSMSTRDALVALGFAPTRIRVIYNGTDVLDLRERRKTPRRLHIAYVGRLKGYKRLDILIRAVAHLRREFPAVQLDLAGDGDARPRLEALVDDLDLRDVVRLHGAVGEETKARILKGARVFATPSLHEGWGISVIEANALGCPAVAFDVPGLREAIRHGETGLLVEDDGDVAAFEAAIAALLRDSALRSRLSQSAQQWAAHFDWDASARSTLETLRTSNPHASTAEVYC